MKFTKLLVLGALLLVGSGVAKAVDANVWQKPTIAAPEVTTFTNYEVGKTVYLYNVASHLFYTNGNNWATRASLIFATNGDGNGATKGQAIRGIKVEFTQTDDAKAKGDDVVELKDDVKGAGTMISAFADAWDGIWTDNNTNANRFWKVTAKDGYYLISNVTTEPDKFLGWQGDFTDTRLYLLEEGAGTQWKMVEEAVYNEWLAAVETSGFSFETFDAAVNLYSAAMKLKEVLDKAEEISADVAAQITVYNNTNSTLDELNTAITAAEEAIQKREKEMAEAGITTATVQNPADATSYIVNPDWAAGSTKGWSQAPSLEKHGDVYTAEFYNTTYDMNQTITGLPEGVYSLNLKGFYREGGYSNSAFEKHLNGKENLNAYIYITQDNDTVTKPLMSIYKEASETGYGNGTEVTVTAGDKTVYIPNMRESAQIYFNDGRYNVNTAYFNSTGADFMIGLKKTVGVGSDWTPFNDFTLKYYGKGADAYQMWLTEQLKDYSELSIPEETVYTEQYKTAYDETLTSEKTATNVDEVNVALTDVTAAYNTLMLNIELWQKYQNLCEKAKQVAANEDYNELARESLADYDMDLQDNLNARVMTNEELQALCDEIEAAIDAAIRAPKDGADVTSYLVNPDFSTDDDTGWTGRNTITDIAHSCAEAYERGDFDLYQVVKNAPLGVYEISLKGFVRDGSNDVAWPAYRDNGAPAAKAFVYMNAKQTPLMNCYDEKFPASYFDLSTGHIYGPTPYGLLDAAGDSLRNEAGESLWVPNGMSTSQDVFDKGYYQRSAFGLVAKAGDEMRIGIKGNLGGTGTWCWAIWDDFRLTYRGFQRDVVLEVLNEEIANVEAYKSLLIGKNVRDIIDKKLADAVAAKDFEKGQDMFGALTELFTVGDTVRASQAIFANLEKAYEKLPTAINESQADLSLVQQATDLQNDVFNNVLNIEPAAVEWTDEKAEATIAAIEQMIKDLAKPAGFANATDDDPKDANWCIVNPKYAENTNEGWTSTANAAVSYNICEVFNADFNYYQDIELSAGTYELTAPGFYRFGSAAEDYTAFNGDATLNNNLSMYVTVGQDSVAVAMPRLASAAQEYTVDVTVATDGTKSFNAKSGYVWVADPVANADSTQATGFIVANNMEQAANEFANGNYGGTTITFKVPEDMKVRIGMTKNVQQSNNWCIWGAWQLTYYGKNSAKAVTGINAAFSNGQVARTEFFNVNGARISTPQRGLVIVKQTMADGTVKVRKVVVK